MKTNLRFASIFVLIVMLSILSIQQIDHSYLRIFSKVLPSQFGIFNFLTLAAIIALSGFISGLSGFGFSAVGALALWLLEPKVVIPLLMSLSTLNQLMSINELKDTMRIKETRLMDGPLPYIVGGIIGVPMGLWLLSTLDAALICTLIGAVLLAYSLWSLYEPKSLVGLKQGPVQNILVGFSGGIIGGFTAFPGCMVVMWAGLAGMDKARQRSIVQPFILAMQMISLTILATSYPERFDVTFWIMFVILASVALPFTKLGVAAFHRMSDVNFKQATHGILSVSGVGLLAKGTPLLLKIAAKAYLLIIAALTALQQTGV